MLSRKSDTKVCEQKVLISKKEKNLFFNLIIRLDFHLISNNSRYA